jgi:hypothetical protein
MKIGVKEYLPIIYDYWNDGQTFIFYSAYVNSLPAYPRVALQFASQFRHMPVSSMSRVIFLCDVISPEASTVS